MKLKHFSIRDLLWLTLAVSLVTAWRIDRSKVAHQRDSLLTNKMPFQITVSAAEVNEQCWKNARRL
jgi:hypothetical protein